MDISKSVIPTSESIIQHVEKPKNTDVTSYTFPDALWEIFSKTVYDTLVNQWKVRKSMDELQY